MQIINRHFVDEILDRIKKITNSVKDSDIADLFEVKPGTISAWRVRNSIDLIKLTEVCEKKGWSLDEIVLGKSTKCEVESTTGNFDLNSYILSRDKKLDEVCRELGRLQEQNRILKKYNPQIDLISNAAEP